MIEKIHKTWFAHSSDITYSFWANITLPPKNIWPINIFRTELCLKKINIYIHNKNYMIKMLYSVHLMAHDNQQILFYTRSNTIKLKHTADTYSEK